MPVVNSCKTGKPSDAGVCLLPFAPAQIFSCGFKKPFGNKPFLGQMKSFGLCCSLAISIDGRILDWKFPRIFPRVWFYQDHHFQAKWLNLLSIYPGSSLGVFVGAGLGGGGGGMWRRLGSTLCLTFRTTKVTLSQSRGEFFLKCLYHCPVMMKMVISIWHSSSWSQ